MNINEMILVMENCKGTEKKYLMTTEDYLKYLDIDTFASRVEVADAMLELGRTMEKENTWAEHYFAPNVSVSARFCKDADQLSEFLLGFYDDTKYAYFDKAMCSGECLDKLDSLGMDTKGRVDFSRLSYSAKKTVFQKGQTLHNFNGHDYRVLEKFSEKDLLLLDIRSGEFLVAKGTRLYARHLHGMEATFENSLEGIEWGEGLYLGNVPSEVDFRHLRQEYGTERKIETIEQYHEMLKERFRMYEKLKEDELLSGGARKMMKSIMSIEFDTDKYERFVEQLKAGFYDCNFLEPQEIKKEKSR